MKVQKKAVNLVHFSFFWKLCPPPPEAKAGPPILAQSLPHTTIKQTKVLTLSVYKPFQTRVVDTGWVMVESPRTGILCIPGASLLLKDLGKYFNKKLG